MSKGWYVLQVYSGHEIRVQQRLKMLSESPEGEFVLDIRVPTEEHVEMRQGKRRNVTKISLPGYIFIELELQDSSWREQCSSLRALQSVVGFVCLSPKERPQPIPADEVRAMLQRSGDLAVEKKYAVHYDFTCGEVLKVTGGPFEGFSGTVDEIFPGKERMRVMVVIFGRPTAVELDFSQVEKDV